MFDTLPQSDTLAPAISRRRKAAIVMRLLHADGQKLSIAALPEESQLVLTREIASLRRVGRTTLEAVAEEFARELEELALTSAGGLDAALDALTDQLSPAANARLRSEAAKARDGDPWTRIVALSATELVEVVTAESTEVGAVLLAKLPVPKAAELLGLLPGATARRLTYAMSKTANVQSGAVARIGRALAIEHCDRPAPVFGNPPVKRVGAILNSVQAMTRDDVLAGLGDDDPAFADEVRRAIFTFHDIPARLAPLEVPKALRGVDQTVLVTALAYANTTDERSMAVVDFLLSNISQRMADQIRDEIGECGKVRPADGQGAMGQLVTDIRNRADAGELTFLSPDEEDAG